MAAPDGFIAATEVPLATDEDEDFLRQTKTYSDLSSKNLRALATSSGDNRRGSSQEFHSSSFIADVGLSSALGNTAEIDSTGISATSGLDNDARQQCARDPLLYSERDKSGTSGYSSGPGIVSLFGMHDYSDKAGTVVLQPSISGFSTSFTKTLQVDDKNEEKEEETLFKTPSPSKVRKRPLEFTSVSKAEHKRWRQEIDGFAQYSEWVAKVNESRSDDNMPDVESSESVTTYDPAEEYFFHTSFPLIDTEERTSITDFINRVNKKISEQEQEFQEIDANLQSDKEAWDQAEEWDAFLAEKKGRKKKARAAAESVHLYICYACGRAFDDERQMREHVNVAHLSNQGYKFKCVKCYRRFKSKPHLQRHEKTHDETATFKCDHCSASYRTRDSLTAHLSRVHSIDKNGALIETLDFECKRCEKSFGTLVELNRHKYFCLKQQHIKSEKTPSRRGTPGGSAASSPKPFTTSSPRPTLTNVCHVCNNKFASAQSLVRHIGRKHPNEQYVRRYEVVTSASTPNLPFVCTECQKRFANVSSLSLHKRRHAGNCPFQCETCGRKYPLASELRKHIRRVHEKQEKSPDDMEATLAETEAGEALEADLPGTSTSKPLQEKELRPENDLSDFTF